jgi:hypothetical protein
VALQAYPAYLESWIGLQRDVMVSGALILVTDQVDGIFVLLRQPVRM